jgi:hypothetical protein
MNPRSEAATAGLVALQEGVGEADEEAAEVDDDGTAG